MNEVTFHGNVVQKKEGMYTVYVFQKDSGEYIMCTKLPNWGEYNIQINDTGYCTVEYANAGDSYYNRNTDTYEKYAFSNIYFKEFIKDKIKTQDIIL